MNVNTGATYDSFQTALDAGEDPDDIVEVIGTPEQVDLLANTVRQQANAKGRNRAANKRARKSRRKNR